MQYGCSVITLPQYLSGNNRYNLENLQRAQIDQAKHIFYQFFPFSQSIKKALAFESFCSTKFIISSVIAHWSTFVLSTIASMLASSMLSLIDASIT